VREVLVPHESIVAETDEIPPEIVAQMRELGLFGLCIPEGYGGLALTMEEEVLVALELAYASPAFRSLIGTNNGIGSQGILIDGTEEQKNAWLPRLAAGEIIGSFALTEPGSGSDAASLTHHRRARRRPLRHQRHQALHHQRARSRRVHRDGAHRPARKGAGGISAFIVERGTPGLSLGKIDKKMGQRGAHTCDVIFENCRVPAATSSAARRGMGFKTAMKVLDKGRLHIAAVCVGVAERMLDDALRYAMERKQFGQPIAEFQLVQAMLADSKAEIYAARSMVLDAARRRDEGATSAPKPRAASCSPPRCAGAWPTARCRSTAAPATCPTTRPSASTATCACSASTKARPRSSNWSSPAT
jgi:acyl-CoA dehydrogenase